MFINMLVLPTYKKNIYYIFCATIHLTLFHALRNPYIYPDNGTYGWIYSDMPTYSLIEIVTENIGWEKGYMLYNYLLAQIFPNTEALFISTSLFMVCTFMFLVYKWSYIPWISVLIYILHPMLFYTSLFVLRQHLAMVIVLLALYFINDYRKSLPLALLGISFHASAVVFLPFFIWNKIYNQSFSIKKILFYVFACVLISRLCFVVIVMLFPRYVHYLDKESSNLFPFVLIASLFVLYYRLGIFKVAIVGKDVILLKYLSFGLLVTSCAIGLPIGRLTSYIIYAYPFLVPLLFKYVKKSDFTLVVLYLIFVLVLLVTNIYMAFSSTASYTTEYKFYWE